MSALLFIGGRVFAGGKAEAVAVKNGRIAAVGDRAGVLSQLSGQAFEVVDLAAGLLVPGFQDAHVHPVAGGLERLQLRPERHATAADYLAAVARVRRGHPDRPWIIGGGWSMDGVPGRHAHRGRRWTRSSPTGRCSCPTATTTARG